MARILFLLSLIIPLWLAAAGWTRVAAAEGCVALEAFFEARAPDDTRWSRHRQILRSALLRLTADEGLLRPPRGGAKAPTDLNGRLRPCWDSATHTITLDFAGATVGADGLSRLVTTPDLLPKFAHAGLTVRNAVIDGTLEIAHATIAFPLRLEGVAFPSPRRDSLARDDRSPAAIRIEGSEFEQTFELARSDIRGLVFVATSSFRDGFRLTGNDLAYAHPAEGSQPGDIRSVGDDEARLIPVRADRDVGSPVDRQIEAFKRDGRFPSPAPATGAARAAAAAAAPASPACAGLEDPAGREAAVARQGAAWITGDERSPRSLQILYSRFNGLVQVQRNCFAGHVLVDQNEFRHVEFGDNLIAEGHLKITGNEVFKLESQANRYATAVEIANNRVASLLDVIDDIVAPVPGTEPGSRPSYRLSVNTVGGSLWFGPAEIAPTVARLELTYNAVVGPFELCLPDGWSGHGPPTRQPKGVDLAGTGVQSRLRLNVGIRGDCGAGRGATDEVRAINDQACHDRPEPASAVIWLTNASTGALSWNLPDDCSYRWAGMGFRYGFIGEADWVPGDGPPPEPATDATEAGRGSGIITPARAEVEPPDHAAGPQQATDSLRADRDAAGLFSRMAQTKDPDALVRLADYFRSQGMFDKSREALLEAKGLSYAPPAECSWASASSYMSNGCVSGTLLYSYLWLGGFGVEPTRPFLLLLWFWLGGWLVYRSYYSYQSRQAARAADVEAAEAEWIRYLCGRDASGRNGRRMHGFLRYDDRRVPEDFRLMVFSLDAMLPVIDLHAYSAYFPAHVAIRIFSYVQHVFGWLLLTSLLAGLAGL